MLLLLLYPDGLVHYFEKYLIRTRIFTPWNFEFKIYSNLLSSYLIRVQILLLSSYCMEHGLCSIIFQKIKINLRNEILHSGTLYNSFKNRGIVFKS